MSENNKTIIINLSQIQKVYLHMFEKLSSFLAKHQLTYYCLGGTALGAVRESGFIPWDDDMDIGMLRCQYQKFLELATELDNKYFIVEHYTNTKKVSHGLIRVYFKGVFFSSSNEISCIRKNFHIDIFPLDNVPLDEKEQKRQSKDLVFLKTLLYYKTHVNNSSFIKNISLKFVRLILSPFSLKFIAKKIDTKAKKYSFNTTGSNFVCSMLSQYSYEKQKMPLDYYGNGALQKFDYLEVNIPEKWNLYLQKLFGDDYMERKQRFNQSLDQTGLIETELFKELFR